MTPHTAANPSRDGASMSSEHEVSPRLWLLLLAEGKKLGTTCPPEVTYDPGSKNYAAQIPGVTQEAFDRHETPQSEWDTILGIGHSANHAVYHLLLNLRNPSFQFVDKGGIGAAAEMVLLAVDCRPEERFVINYHDPSRSMPDMSDVNKAMPQTARERLAQAFQSPKAKFGDAKMEFGFRARAAKVARKVGAAIVAHFTY